jgi:N-formylglutamate amidohydrolase
LVQESEMKNAMDTENCGYTVAEPAGSDTRAVVLSVPHAGRDYPLELLANLRVPADKLLKLEDRYADLLVRQEAGVAGFATITAHRARAWLDLNRGPEDLDRTMLVETKGGIAAALTRRLSGQILSARARGGLGLIPRRLPDCGELWARPIDVAEAEARLRQYHAPYHSALSVALSARRKALGAAVLLDVHSMPPLTPEWGEYPADIVIGDLFGMSAPDRLVAPMMELARAHGFTPALNNPYAGGYVLRRHGRPANSVFAIQLEVSRALYLDAPLREPDPDGVARVRALVAAMAELLNQLARQGFRDWPMAAE